MPNGLFARRLSKLRMRLPCARLLSRAEARWKYNIIESKCSTTPTRSRPLQLGRQSAAGHLNCRSWSHCLNTVQRVAGFSRDVQKSPADLNQSNSLRQLRLDGPPRYVLNGGAKIEGKSQFVSPWSPPQELVGAAGLEPATLGLEGRCSIHLSYAPVRVHCNFVSSGMASEIERTFLF